MLNKQSLADGVVAALKVDGLRGGAGSGAPTYGYRQRAPVPRDGVADFPLGENLHA